MELILEHTAPPSQCGYLPEQLWSLHYELFREITASEYMQRMANGWRRFGRMLFQPRCPGCQQCQSIRVSVDHFRPNRSQKRARKANENEVELRIGPPAVTKRKLRLYDQYHSFQSTRKGWPDQPAKDAESYIQSFVDNPFETEEWCYYLGHELIGLGYVDVLPGGASAIYFFYDPDQRNRSLGTWNVLRLIEECQVRRIPHLYLGYYVPGSESLEYKANFKPNELLGSDGVWRPFSFAAS